MNNFINFLTPFFLIFLLLLPTSYSFKLGLFFHSTRDAFCGIQIQICCPNLLQQLAKAATLLDDCNLGKDPSYGNQGWEWHSISRDGKKYVKHRNCPGGLGTTTTTAPTTIPPSTTTGPSTEPPTTTIPPPTTIPPTEYVPMIEDNHFPIAEETQTDEFLEGESGRRDRERVASLT